MGHRNGVTDNDNVCFSQTYLHNKSKQVSTISTA